MTRTVNLAIHALGRLYGLGTPWVYVALIGGAVKIGMTCDLGQRLELLTKTTKKPVELLGVTPGSRPEESALHRQFHAQQRRELGREWFRDCPEIRAFVAALPPEQRPVGLVQPYTAPRPMTFGPVQAPTFGRPYRRSAAAASASARRSAEVAARNSARECVGHVELASAIAAARSTPSLGAF